MSKNLSPNIAVIKLSALGDIVHAVVILQFIEKHLPKAKITWFADAKFSEILFLCPQISRVVSLPLKNGEYKTSLELIASAKQEGEFDYVIDLQGLIKSAAVAKLLGKNSYGFDKFSAREPLAALFYRHKFNCDYGENIILRNLKLTAFALGFSFSEDEILRTLSRRPQRTSDVEAMFDEASVQLLKRLADAGKVVFKDGFYEIAKG